jgi:hypothetical protein
MGTGVEIDRECSNPSQKQQIMAAGKAPVAEKVQLTVAYIGSLKRSTTPHAAVRCIVEVGSRCLLTGGYPCPLLMYLK